MKNENFHPNYSPDIERSVIGATITYFMDGREGKKFPQEVEKEDFYEPTHKIIWGYIEKLYDSGNPIDIVSLSSTISENDKERGINNACIYNIISSSFSVPSLDFYIKSLKDLRRMREVSKIGDSLLIGEKDPGKIILYSKKLEEIASIGLEGRSGNVTHKDVDNAYELMVSRMGKKVWGYSWGSQFSFLDTNTRGIIKKQVTRIGAPSGVGKSQFAYNVITELMKQKNEDGTPVKVLFFTLENPKEITLISLLCKAKGYDIQALSDGEIDGDWDYLHSLEDRLFIVDELYEIDDIFAKVVEVKPDVVFLDYIGYVNVKGYEKENKYQEYANRVVPFAKKNNVAWIDLSNLPNECKTNEDIRFKAKFYGASELVNNADINIFIMRNEEFQKASERVFRDRFLFQQKDIDFFRTRSVIDMVITKNRWQRPGWETIYSSNSANGGIWKELSRSDLLAMSDKFG